jgi:hypothetical protein
MVDGVAGHWGHALSLPHTTTATGTEKKAVLVTTV